VSARDPDAGANLALLAPAAFRDTRPDKHETWRLFPRDTVVQAVCKMPRRKMEFSFSAWAFDPLPGAARIGQAVAAADPMLPTGALDRASTAMATVTVSGARSTACDVNSSDIVDTQT
jgi:hypothetical protein